MSRYAYAFKEFDEKTMARVMGRDVSISWKTSIEICNRIRGKSTVFAKTLLQDVLDMERPIRHTRFTNGLGHKKGKGASGRYPQKASKEILSLIESAEKNAQQKGLNTSRLMIVHILANRAAAPMHFGRQRGISMKRAHVSIVIAEGKAEEKKVRKAKPAQKKEDSSDAKPKVVKNADAPKKESKPRG